MSESMSRGQRIAKRAVHGKGVVVAQNQAAADVGAAVLARGGNAVDAAVATGLAIGCVEPWMSGIGGVGFMTHWNAASRTAFTVDYGPVAARGLDPADYPVVGAKTPGDLFGWAPVLEDRNLHGARSVVVPGLVDGMATALSRFGTWTWQDAIAPAVELAKRGMPADWYATLLIATEAKNLARYPASRDTFLPGGHPAVTDWAGTDVRLRLGNLANTLERLRDAGPREYYEGAIADDIVADLRAGGSAIAREDLASYRARVVEPLSFAHNGATIHVAGGLTAGPTLQRALGLMAQAARGSGVPDAAFFAAAAEGLNIAYAERLETMGDRSVPSCTTHFCVVDAAGNMVSQTQTLLSLFGSRLMLPRTGILMNNGMMWFDPEPGKPNSIAPGKRPLTNICPVAASRNGEGWFVAGASGGRRIVPAVAQIVSMLVDRGMDPETIFHTPRIDVSGTGPVRLNRALPEAVKRTISAKMATVEVDNVIYPLNFANPSCIVRDAATGTATGMAEVLSPWADGAAAG